MTDAKSGVKRAMTISPMAKTPAKATITDNSQLSFRNSPTIGTSLTSGMAEGAKRKATTAAPIQPTMAISSRTNPRE